MSNNMDLGYEMFCYQCEQTAGGKGCTKQGVCGKTAEVANLQDLLLYQLKGISVYAKALMDAGENPEPRVVRFVENCLFTTLTNVNFDAAVHVDLLKQSQKIKEELRGRTKKARLAEPKAVQAAFNLPETKSEMLRVAAVAVLLALLSLGIRGIYLGPTLPAFLSPNVLQYLVDTFDLRLTSNAEDDLKSCLAQKL